MPLPAVTITGKVHCALCGQLSVDTEGDALSLGEVVRLVRAHQRSEICG